MTNIRELCGEISWFLS